jgi:hypothetical protein
MGLTMYVAFDRKPDNACAYDGHSGIMMQAKLVKSAVQEALEAAREHSDMTNDQYIRIATPEDEKG